MHASVVVPAYNSEKTIGKCLDALIQQSFKEKFEIIVVDDGSKDGTKEIVRNYLSVKYIYQKNAGPAAARNNGWQNSKGKIVVFTDSDCVPEKDWLKQMVEPFKNKQVGAVGGAYDKTVNSKSLLAKLIGEEIKYRYSRIGEYTDAQGAYSLGVRKEILERLKGFNEFYPVATAEDWDLSYRILDLGFKIYFNRKAQVGHHHPEKLWKYLKTQYRHGFYVNKLYRDNPKKTGGDKYSGDAKIQVIFTGLFILSLVINPPLSLVFLIFLLFLQKKLFGYLSKSFGFMFAAKDVGLQILRGFSWLFGILNGLLLMLFSKQ